MSFLYRNIIHDLLSRDGIQLTLDQEKALEEFYRFHASPEPRSAMLLRGAAGTGKTFLIRLITRFLLRQGYKVALLAPTGRAAKVITRRTKRYASTIHRYIYSPVESPGGNVFFNLKENKDQEKIYYIVDEASMVGDGGEEGGSGLLADLLKFAYLDFPMRRVLMVGDPAQLPPVGSQISPALDPVYMKKWFGMEVYSADMTEVMRQESSSEILIVANAIRESMEGGFTPNIEIGYGGDVEIVDNGYEALELYTGLYREDDPDQVLFITYSNKVAVDVNRAIRKQLFDTEQELIPGDILMVVRNNYAWGNKKFPFIANGEMGVVREIHPETYEEKYGLRWMNITMEFLDVREEVVEIDCKVVLDLLDNKQAQINYASMKAVIQERRLEYEKLSKTQRMASMRSDPYINALQVKYGYAVTGHKAQGGQWKNVIIGFEPLYPGMSLPDYLRWTYTALTRPEERLYVLNFPFVNRDF